MIAEFIEIFLHLDKHLGELVAENLAMAYGIMFLIVFMETAFVVTPFLPGDSLLFAAGALAALTASDPQTGLPVPGLQIAILLPLLFVAAVVGDTINYHIGKYIGPKVFNREGSFFFNKNHLLKAQAFYEKYGKKTIILARFVPIVRTFAPFVAGIGVMQYRTFIIYNIIGGAAWCAICLFAGYWFGNIPIVKNNFSIVVLAIIAISVLPMVVEFFMEYKRQAKAKGNA